MLNFIEVKESTVSLPLVKVPFVTGERGNSQEQGRALFGCSSVDPRKQNGAEQIFARMP